MKILILSLSLLFLISTSAGAGFYEPLEAGVLVASAQKRPQSTSGTVVIKGKGGKVTDVEQRPDDGKKKKKKKKDTKAD